MNGSNVKGMGVISPRPLDYICLTVDAKKKKKKYVDNYKDDSLRKICDKAMHFLRGNYSNYSLELLSTVDYLLETKPEMKGWKDADEEDVVSFLEHEIKEWSFRKGKMFDASFITIALQKIKEL